MKIITKLGCFVWLAISAASTQATTVTNVCAGFGHSLFIKSDGSLWGMGYNGYGELGDGTTNWTLVPKQSLPGGVTAVAIGYFHSVFIKSGGSLWGAGHNEYGELGDGTTNNVLVPKQLVAGGVVAIAATYYQTFYVKSDGSLWGMGNNTYGQLGAGTNDFVYTPVEIVASGVTAVAPGLQHTLFTKTDGSLWAMGDNSQGAFGDGTTNSSIIPRQIFASGVTTISAGKDNSLFQMCNESLWGMGNNFFGTLGTGGQDKHERPAGLFPSGVALISTSVYYHSLVVMSDSTLLAMGLNFYGQLGLGTNLILVSPQFVATNVVAISAGYYYSLFIKSDGTLWGMGDNIGGVLGDGSLQGINVPEQIVPLVLIPNGGFERGDFSSWTASGNLAYSGVSINPSFVHSGTYGAEMGTGGAMVFLSQTVRTAPGSNYVVSFWLNCPGGSPNQFQVSWDGVQLFSQNNLPASGWTNFQFVVTASSTNAALSFGFRNDPFYFGLDDVTVLPQSLAAKPSLMGINLAGTNLTLNGANGSLGATYSTLMSTNVAKPLNQWTPVATNVLGASGNFTITVTNGASLNAAQRFYILQLQ